MDQFRNQFYNVINYLLFNPFSTIPKQFRFSIPIKIKVWETDAEWFGNRLEKDKIQGTIKEPLRRRNH